MRVKESVLSELGDYLAWSRGGEASGPVSLLDYVGFIATLDMLFGFAELFQPELVVHQGRRFLASGFTTVTYDAWAEQGRTPEEIQRVMNHIHVSTLLQNQQVSDDAAVEAARVIAAVWSRTLGSQGLTAKAVGSTFSDAAVTCFEGTA